MSVLRGLAIAVLLVLVGVLAVEVAALYKKVKKLRKIIIKLEGDEGEEKHEVGRNGD